MLNLLNLNREVTVNGKTFSNSKEAYEEFKDYEGELTITIGSSKQTDKPSEAVTKDKEYKVTVRPYMTKESTPEFDFMEKWNNNNPMPMRTMVGTILEETRGMYKMQLQCKPEASKSCLHCGRKLTNPISFNYGIGPVCGGHFNLSTPKTEQEYKQRKKEIQDQLESIVWEGYVIKKAITELKPVG